MAISCLNLPQDVGKLVDCTSYYELEQQEYARKGVNLTPDLWMMKLMVGAVDRSYDEQVCTVDIGFMSGGQVPLRT